MSPGIVAESDLSGNLKSEYVFFDGERVARKDFPGNSVFYYFSDHLKTASVITDSAGTIKEDEDYYPWGGELQFVNSDSNHYKFTSKERDSETGLDYFGARYYGNWLGRFVTPDWSSTPVPVPYADLGDPQSLNQYTYVRNIPTSKADIDGHDIWDVVDFFVGAANAMASDNLGGALRFESGTTANNLGHVFGDGVALIQGAAETLLGGGGEVLGGGLDATGVGAPLGILVQAGSTTLILHGGSTFLTAGRHLLGRTPPPNPHGSAGAPDHQAKVDQLVGKAKSEAKPGETVESNKQVKGLNSTRRPDAQIISTKGKTRKAFEAERHPHRARNKKREAEYKKLKLPNETHPVK